MNDVIVSIRPERMRIASAAPGSSVNRLAARVVETTFLGEASEHVLESNQQRFRVIAAPPMFDLPADVHVTFDVQDVVVLSE